MNTTYKSAAGIGSITLSFDEKKIFFNSYVKVAGKRKTISMDIDMVDITDIAIFELPFSISGFLFIINDIRYVSEDDEDLTRFFAKKSEFSKIKEELQKIIIMNGIDSFKDTRSIDAKKVTYDEDEVGLKYSLISNNTKSSIKVYEDYLVIVHSGAYNYLMKGGLKGEKRIYFNSISAIEFRKANITFGYLQFSIYGSDRLGGIYSAATDENSITFGSDQNEVAEKIVNYIESRRQNRDNQKENQIVQQISVADEIKKFKELLDMGIITQEEFDAKKKQLLDL